MIPKDNKLEISQKFKKLRIDRVNSWKPRLKENEYDYLFPIEKDFLSRINIELSQNELKIFTPLNYPYNLDKDYHIYISYFIECLDVLPLKMDLSFDFSWKGLEFYMGKAYEKHKGDRTTNISDLIKYSNNNYWADVINSNHNIQNYIEQFLKLIPSQSYEYLGKRMLDKYTIINPRENPLYTRLAMTNGNIDVKMDSLLKDLFTKYGTLNDAEITRKVGRIMFKLLNGETIDLPDSITVFNTNNYSLTLKEKLNVIVNGVLYTYRNERFHGNTFSPFKSSKASLMTYSHAQYSFLWTYFLVNMTKLYLNNINISTEEIENNMRQNIETFSILYGRHLTK
jgi:hypothetical protein